MTFLLRQVSRTADGREIVRSSTAETNIIVIGRAADCDVHLADLAVELRHARVTLLDDGDVLVEAIAGLGFSVDGQHSLHAVIKPAVGAELRFGSHRLTVGREADAVTIAAERVEALSDANATKEEIGLFTLKGLIPGRRVSAWSFIGLVLAAFLVWPITSYFSYQNVKARPAAVHGDASWSSGPLSSAHQGLKGDCQACHTQAFVAVSDKACVTCHEDTHDHADPKRLALAKGAPGVGGAILASVAQSFNRPEGRCVECHTEHEGAGPMQPTAQQFCSNCHSDLSKRLGDTKIADAEDFGKSHPQFRAAVVTQPGAHPVIERISLDKKPVAQSGLKFPHNIHLSRSNGVARMAQTMRGEFGFGDALACKDCHTKTSDGVRFQPVDMEQDCAMCHSLAFETIGGTVRTLRHGDPKQVIADLRAYYRSGGPYNGVNLGGQARRRPGDYAQGRPYFASFGGGGINYGRAESAIRAVFSKGGACYDCHTVAAPPPGSDDWRVMPVNQTARYFQKGWFTHDAHKTEKCESCHVAGKSSKATDLLIPGIANCRTCHGGEASRADVPSACAACHSYHADSNAPWVPRNRVAVTQEKGFAP
jgi:hypothetical protein